MFLFSLAIAEPISTCAAWGEGERIEVTDLDITESSGLAAARATSDVFYTLQDAGGDPILYLFSSDGSGLGEQAVQGAENIDWEDLAPGPCPASVGGADCLYIGDIGDNDGNRDEIVVYVVPESTGPIVEAAACRLSYPDGEAHDAEALLISPDGTLRIVTKSGEGDPKVYRLDAPACDGGLETLEEEAELSLSGEDEADREVTGGAMSADGGTLVLRSYSQAWVWRGCQINWSKPEVFSLASEPNGEAITFVGDTLYTSSEGTPFRVWALPCATPDQQRCCGCGGDSAGLLLVPLLVLVRRRRA